MGGKLAARRNAVSAAEVTIWHNPRCSKSRQTLELVRSRGIEPEVREYLMSPPSEAELEQVLTMAGLEPRAMMRTKEPAYRELGLGDDSLSRAELVAAMASNPGLIERPLVLRGDKAVLGRPPENVLGIL